MTWKNETTRQPLPAPLPMYEPVRLKHVPTFVRRRYDRDLKKIDDANEGLSSEEGKSDGDGVEDDDPTALTPVSDVDDSFDNNEVEDDTHANFDSEHDTHSYREDCGSSNIESKSSTYEGDSKIMDDKDQDVNDVSSHVDASVEDNTEDQGHAKFDMNDHGSYSKDCEDEDDGAKDVDLVGSVDANVENDVHDIERDYVDSGVKNEVQDNEEDVYAGFLEQDHKSDDDKSKDGIVASLYENGSVQHGNFNKEQGFPEEDDKSEGDEAEDVIHDAAGPDLDDSVDYEADDDAQANNFDTKHGTNADTSVNNGAQHDEQGRVYVGFHEQDNNIDNDGAKDGIIASWHENGVQDNIEDDEHGYFDKQQGFPEEDDKSEGNPAEDVIHDSASPDLDDSIDYEAEDDAQANFDTKHDTNTYTTESFDTNNLEKTKFEGEILHRDGASSMEASVEDSINDHGHENSDIKDQDFEEEDGANNDMNIAYVDTSVNNGVHSDQHREKGLYNEDRETEHNGTMNAHIIEFKDIERGNFDDKQDLRVEDCKRVEVGTKDVTVASNYMDESVKLEEIIEKQYENLDIKQGIYQAQSSSFASIPWLARRLIQVQWDPSSINFHKLNFDGLSTSSPQAGIIIRDSYGAILSAQVYKMGLVSPIVAEAWSLRNGLLQANQLGRSYLCIEGDNRLLIRNIYRDYRCPWNLQFLVEAS